MKKINIIGGGIGGLCTAIALHQRGFQVQVFENAPSIRPLGAGIVLAANAIKALDKLGIRDALVSRGKLLKQFNILSEGGKVITATDSEAISRQFGYAGNFTIHRADLHAVLLSQLPAGTLHLGKQCLQVSQDSSGVRVNFADGSEVFSDALIASDGIHSVIRQQLLPASVPRYAGYTCWRGVTNQLPADWNDTIATETWGSKGRVGIVPLTNGRIYWFVCINAPQNDGQMAKITSQHLAFIFKDYHLPISSVLAATSAEQTLWNDIMDIKPIDRFAFDRVVLLGDAAHATTPNMGQGACQAIEDAVVLANCLNNDSKIADAFLAFEKLRIKRTTAVVNRSWQIGKLAQLENPWLAQVRNRVMRLMPAKMNEKQVKFLYDVDF